MTEQKIEKPISVTVFGVLNIVFGGFGLLFSSLATFGLVTAGDASKMASTYRIFLLFMNVAGFGFSVWLLTLGIGLLGMRGWARRGSVLYGWLGIILSVTETAVNFLALILNWITVPAGGVSGYIVGICISLVGGLIYPVLLLIFMQTARVKQAFQARGQSA
jgi:hypothetical protein